MASRSPVRFLAPLALIVVVVAVLLMIQGASSGDGGNGGTPPAASTTKSRSQGGKRSSSSKTRTGTTSTTASTAGKTYTVKPGDTFGTISAATGLSIAEIQTLNPDADPNSLTVGQTLRLTR